MTDRLIFESEDGEQLELMILERTVIGGTEYILGESEDEAYILKKVTSDDEEFEVYEFVDDEEAEAVSKVFSELLDDIALE